MAEKTLTYISLGNDCGVAEYLRNAGVRTAAFPFDWAVSYGGAAHVIRDIREPDIVTSACSVDSTNFNEKYGIFHMHMDFPQAIPTMTKRFERLREMIDTASPSSEVVFIRKSHPLHHHFERPQFLCDEVADARELARYFEMRSKGGIRIELMLTCDLCHPKIDASVESAGILRVHNLTRGPSASFAERYPTKTYADAMGACLESIGVK